MNQNKQFHTVSSGENLSSIAKRYNTTVNELVKLNNIKNPNLININQKIRITDNPKKDLYLQDDEDLIQYQLEKIKPLSIKL